MPADRIVEHLFLQRAEKKARPRRCRGGSPVGHVLHHPMGFQERLPDQSKSPRLCQGGHGRLTYP